MVQQHMYGGELKGHIEGKRVLIYLLWRYQYVFIELQSKKKIKRLENKKFTSD